MGKQRKTSGGAAAAFATPDENWKDGAGMSAVDMSACDAPDPAALARAEQVRGEIHARRARAQAQVDDRIRYKPGYGDREAMRRAGRG